MANVAHSTVAHSTKAAIISGVGPEQGMGAQLARCFAASGLHVFVAGGTQRKLDAVVAAIQGTGGQATAVVADATDEQATIELFTQARKIGPIDLVIYNTSNNTPGRFEEMSAEFFEKSWRVCCFDGFEFLYKQPRTGWSFEVDVRTAIENW